MNRPFNYTMIISLALSIIFHFTILFNSKSNEKKTHSLFGNNLKTIIKFGGLNQDNFNKNKNNQKNKLSNIKENGAANNDDKQLLSLKEIKQIKDSYEEKVLLRIHKMKYYPESARRMNKEGIIQINFQLDKNGNLLGKINIEKKCKHDILNYAAIETIKRAAPFESFPVELKVDLLKFLVKIEYKINL